LTIEEARSLYLSLGNPSNATESASDADNYLMIKPEYALSYNRERGGPNWVVWHVTISDLGKVKRKDDFRPDSSLPSGWPRVTPSDYTRSGYDKGHVCPSADRTSDPQTNSATFLMTNMIPQTGDNNRGPWKLLEDYCRNLVESGNDVFIIAGAYGEKERLKDKVSVPTNTWKVVVVVPQGASSADEVTNDTRVIAINIPNNEGIKDDDWRKYKTTARAIEQATGLNLLNKVRSDVQNVIENRLDDK
jgi:endonuclease G